MGAAWPPPPPRPPGPRRERPKSAVASPPLTHRPHDQLRRAGNPFRIYFARHPDDDVCARYHVPELFATERQQLLGVVDLYRYDPTTHSEVVPILGNKGAGKTHLLYSIKHGSDAGCQLLVTPGTYQKDADFLEYLLFQIIDTLLGGGQQKGARPIEFVGDELVRTLLIDALNALSAEQRLDLFALPSLGRWARKLGLGSSQAQERTQWLLETLAAPPRATNHAGMYRSSSVVQSLQEVNLSPERACELVCRRVEQTQGHNTAGLMRRHIYQGFAKAVLLGDETELANFLTFGFAELEYRVRPTRQDLVLALAKALMEVFLRLRIPVVVAFDQLEDLLLARRSDDAHRVAEAFFAGIVQAMHQLPGLCFLIFAERGLWNRFVPSLDGYIQDRLNNPVHVPGHGTIKALRLEAPPPPLVRRVVEARLRPTLQELPDAADVSPIFPFTEEQVTRIARTEPTLRDMLQQFRHLFDHLVYGAEQEVGLPSAGGGPSTLAELSAAAPASAALERAASEVAGSPSAASPTATPPAASAALRRQLSDLWDQEHRAGRRKLEPDGALTGATRELQAGLGSFLQVCHEHGVKVGPWRLQHVVPELCFGDHPTYGALTIAHWVCKDGQPWKVGIGLFLGRGNGKPKDLEIKLAAFDAEPPIIDHLILLRPEDDLSITGKSKTLWQAAERQGRHARLEAVSLDNFAVLYSFPRWLAAATEALPDGQPLPNLADLIQEKCEKLLEQVCMPVQGG
ncbi:MAG: hypothetical protein NZ700_14545 [Gemmataceae bacterium]|nr:hypothetical protein [Gemmataceae bacterium]MDW8264710.1 hypothetical protein [Gemmataceae bacterium]